MRKLFETFNDRDMRELAGLLIDLACNLHKLDPHGAHWHAFWTWVTG